MYMCLTYVCCFVCSYPEFAPMFKAEMFDPDEWADLFQKSGAKCEINQLCDYNPGRGRFSSCYLVGWMEDMESFWPHHHDRLNLVIGVWNLAMVANWALEHPSAATIATYLRPPSAINQPFLQLTPDTAMLFSLYGVKPLSHHFSK